MKENKYILIGDTIEKISMKFIGIMAIICLFVVNACILARLMKISISWGDEIIKIIFIYIIYIGTALAYKSDDLIGITMLEDSFNKNKKLYRILKIIQHIVIISFAIFCMCQSYLMFFKQLKYGELTPALEIPAAISTLGFVIGSIIWVYYGIEKLFYYIKIYKNKTE